MWLLQIWHLGNGLLRDTKPGEMTQRRSQRCRIEGIFSAMREGLWKVRRTPTGYWAARGEERRRGDIKGQRRRGERWSVAVCAYATVHLRVCLCRTEREITQKQTTRHNVHTFADAHPQLIGLFIARVLPGITCAHTLRLAQREHWCVTWEMSKGTVEERS